MIRKFVKEKHDNKIDAKKESLQLVNEALYAMDELKTFKDETYEGIKSIDSNVATRSLQTFDQLKKAFDDIRKDLKDFEEKASSEKIKGSEIKAVKEKLQRLLDEKKQFDQESKFILKNKNELGGTNNTPKSVTEFKDNIKSVFENTSLKTDNIYHSFQEQKLKFLDQLKGTSKDEANELGNFFQKQQIKALKKLGKQLVDEVARLKNFSLDDSRKVSLQYNEKQAKEVDKKIKALESKADDPKTALYVPRMIDSAVASIETLRNSQRWISEKAPKKEESKLDFETPQPKFEVQAINGAYDAEDMIKDRASTQSAYLNELMDYINGRIEIDDPVAFVDKIIKLSEHKAIPDNLVKYLEKQAWGDELNEINEKLSNSKEIELDIAKRKNILSADVKSEIELNDNQIKGVEQKIFALNSKYGIENIQKVINEKQVLLEELNELKQKRKNLLKTIQIPDDIKKYHENEIKKLKKRKVKLEKKYNAKNLSPEEAKDLRIKKLDLKTEAKKALEELEKNENEWKTKDSSGFFKKIWKYTGRYTGLRLKRRSSLKKLNSIYKQVDGIDKQLTHNLVDKIDTIKDQQQQENEIQQMLVELKALMEQKVHGSPETEDQEQLKNNLNTKLKELGVALNIDLAKEVFVAQEKVKSIAVPEINLVVEHQEDKKDLEEKEINLTEAAQAFVNMDTFKLPKNLEFRKNFLKVMDDSVGDVASNDEKIFYAITAFNAIHGIPLWGRLNLKSLYSSDFEKLNTLIISLDKNPADYFIEEHSQVYTDSDKETKSNDFEENFELKAEEKKEETSEEPEPIKKEKKTTTQEKKKEFEKKEFVVNSFISSLNLTSQKSKKISKQIFEISENKDSLSDLEKKKIRNRIVNLVRLSLGLDVFRKEDNSNYPQLPDNFKKSSLFELMKRLGNVFGIDDTDWDSSFRKLEEKSDYTKKLSKDLKSIWKYENKNGVEKTDYEKQIDLLIERFTSTGNNEELVKYLFDRYKSITSEELNAKIGDGNNKKLKSRFRKILRVIDYTLKNDFEIPEDSP